MTTARQIYLNKKNKVIVEKGTSEANAGKLAVAATFGKNLEPLGFTISKSLWERLLTLSIPEIDNLYNDIVPILQEQVGAHRSFKPFYPNFPKQVMEASEVELFINAMLHYWLTDSAEKQVLPNYTKEDRPVLTEKVKLRVIDLGSHEDFESLFTKLVGSNSSISESDKEIVAWFIEKYQDDIARLLPVNIPQKEQLAFVISHALKRVGDSQYLSCFIKTATDVLRVAAGMSEGDVSLAKPTKFRSFTRKERRFLLSALSQCKAVTEDMLRWQGRWVRLAHGLHFGEYARTFPGLQESFDVIRNKLPFATFNHKVEALLKEKNVSETIALLRNRPGDFARRLDHILRLDIDTDLVIKSFAVVADQVSTPVLLQVHQHFKSRSVKKNVRAFFPKGNMAKMQVSKEVLPVLSEKIAGCVVNTVRKALVSRFGNLPSLGSVYLDEKLKTQFVPAGLRSASKSLRTITRGSRLDLDPDAKVIRFFLWWKNIELSRVDIDLSIKLLKKDWSLQSDVAYYNLRGLGCHHSGDITSAPHGACEFIDLTIDQLVKSGAAYAVMSLNSYTGQPFSDLPECFAGWMARQEPNSGEVFEAKTVLDKIDLTSSTKQCVPVVLDLLNRQVIWTDVAMNGGRRHTYGDTNLFGVGQALAELDKPTLYDLFEMHVEARGEKTTNKKKADTIFSVYEGITPFDTEKIMSEFMV